MVTRKYSDQDILVALANGLSRQEIAEKLGHMDSRSIDNYMRSQGYAWNKELGSYRRLRTTIRDLNTTVETSERVIEIISHFATGMNAREVATRFGFANNRELADYMKHQGFKWNAKTNNYEPISASTKAKETPLPSKTMIEEYAASLTSFEVDFLKELLTFRDVLMPMLQVKATLAPKLPSYQMKGITHSKSVQMSASLDELLRTFCSENKMSQKQVFEIALIEFLQKYGYENQLGTLLKFSHGTFAAN